MPQSAEMQPAAAYEADLADLSSSSFDRFDDQRPAFAFADADQSASFTSLGLLASPLTPSPMYSSLLINHTAAALTLPPPMSLFPSMSAVANVPQPAEPAIHDPPPSSTATLTATTTVAEPWTARKPPAASSSFPSTDSSLSSSSSQSESRPTSVSPPPKQSREQRKLSKRLKQRRADLHRRKRETTALSEMKQLIAAANQLTGSGERDHVPSEGTQHRVQILESSAKRMRELQLLVNLLSQTCDAQQREIHALSHRLEQRHDDSSTMPPFSFFQHDTSLNMSSEGGPSKRIRLLATTLSSTINGSIGYQSLQSARCSPVVLGAMLVECASGTVLDINDGMMVQGWQRHQLVGRTVMESYKAVMDDQGWQLGEHPEQRLLVPSSAGGELRPANRPAQYERSKRLMRELYAGTIGVCVALWRCHLSDGRLYDVRTTTWIDGWEGASDAAGGVSRHPRRAVSVTSAGDCKLIE